MRKIVAKIAKKSRTKAKKLSIFVDFNNYLAGRLLKCSSSASKASNQSAYFGTVFKPVYCFMAFPKSIKNFFNCRYIASGNGENSLIEFYGYTLGDILKDKKYNDRISWSYKHGWVEENDDSEESNASYDKDQYEEPVYS